MNEQDLLKAENFYNSEFKTSYAHSHTLLSLKIMHCMKEYASLVLDHAAKGQSDSVIESIVKIKDQL